MAIFTGQIKQTESLTQDILNITGQAGAIVQTKFQANKRVVNAQIKSIQSTLMKEKSTREKLLSTAVNKNDFDEHLSNFGSSSKEPITELSKLHPEGSEFYDEVNNAVKGFETIKDSTSANWLNRQFTFAKKEDAERADVDNDIREAVKPFSDVKSEATSADNSYGRPVQNTIGEAVSSKAKGMQLRTKNNGREYKTRIVLGNEINLEAEADVITEILYDASVSVDDRMAKVIPVNNKDGKMVDFKIEFDKELGAVDKNKIMTVINSFRNGLRSGLRGQSAKNKEQWTVTSANVTDEINSMKDGSRSPTFSKDASFNFLNSFYRSDDSSTSNDGTIRTMVDEFSAYEVMHNNIDIAFTNGVSLSEINNEQSSRSNEGHADYVMEKKSVGTAIENLLENDLKDVVGNAQKAARVAEGISVGLIPDRLNTSLNIFSGELVLGTKYSLIDMRNATEVVNAGVQTSSRDAIYGMGMNMSSVKQISSVLNDYFTLAPDEQKAQEGKYKGIVNSILHSEKSQTKKSQTRSVMQNTIFKGYNVLRDEMTSISLETDAQIPEKLSYEHVSAMTIAARNAGYTNDEIAIVSGLSNNEEGFIDSTSGRSKDKLISIFRETIATHAYIFSDDKVAIRTSVGSLGSDASKNFGDAVQHIGIKSLQARGQDISDAEVGSFHYRTVVINKGNSVDKTSRTLTVVYHEDRPDIPLATITANDIINGVDDEGVPSNFYKDNVTVDSRGNVKFKRNTGAAKKTGSTQTAEQNIEPYKWDGGVE